MASSTLLMSSSQGQLSMTGEPQKADGWYGYGDGLHTVAIYVQNFQGRIYIEGSIADEPTEEDWFAIMVTTSPYVQYPVNVNDPTGDMGGDTGAEAFTFRTNVVWLRARLDRSYMGEITDSQQISNLGIVRKILLSR
jgi:hypothetical protein